MNFFFHTSNNFLTSRLTIPKFQNSGKINSNLNLFQADIIGGNWRIEQANAYDDEYFWVIKSNTHNKNSIYFLARNEEAKIITSNNALSSLNSFTDTMPDYRSNLEVTNSVGATSSYQSEFPFRMTEKLGSLYSDCGMLTASNAEKVGVFLRNIHTKPIRTKSNLYLFDNKNNTLLQTFQISLNETCYIDLTPFKKCLSTCFIFAKDYLGIPVYLIEYSNGGLSFEHTHPPHESIHGKNRFLLVNLLKAKAHEKIS